MIQDAATGVHPRGNVPESVRRIVTRLVEEGVEIKDLSLLLLTNRHHAAVFFY